MNTTYHTHIFTATYIISPEQEQFKKLLSFWGFIFGDSCLGTLEFDLFL